MQDSSLQERKTVLLIIGLLALALFLGGLKAKMPEYSCCALNPEEVINASCLQDDERVRILSAPNNETVNINIADKNELCRLSGIGEVIAQRIIDYRSNSGAFKSSDEIMNIKGIGPKKYEKIKNLISVK